MPYDEQLASRIRTAVAGRAGVTEKKMFGGVAFLSHGHMFVGVSDRALMVRVGKALRQDSLARPHARVMAFTGKPMAGYVFVDAPGIATAATLRFWIDRALDFVATLPPKAKG